MAKGRWRTKDKGHSKLKQAVTVPPQLDMEIGIAGRAGSICKLQLNGISMTLKAQKCGRRGPLTRSQQRLSTRLSTNQDTTTKMSQLSNQGIVHMIERVEGKREEAAEDVDALDVLQLTIESPVVI
ncbi:predicted protein [Histoplasma capsulatum G186AR]|uniref:Uncharacterized protein n=1 Tax=Ajellomyces capsulatus (strain G186AR / H82 / ATCC MYA-2454 / RMSCC 2432) TaxID=447093 RepID=C0NZM1_AJECG|nr:uncharacterized protein HCBG_08601 [Histoplasma capsulatum G186AR]EEH03269.1 predicted protein [Histoplasma capsulatum G186AR]